MGGRVPLVEYELVVCEQTRWQESELHVWLGNCTGEAMEEHGGHTVQGHLTINGNTIIIAGNWALINEPFMGFTGTWHMIELDVFKI